MNERPVPHAEAWPYAARFNDCRKYARLALEHGNRRTDIKVEKWAESYGISDEDVRRAWDLELSAWSLRPRGEVEE